MFFWVWGLFSSKFPLALYKGANSHVGGAGNGARGAGGRAAAAAAGGGAAAGGVVVVVVRRRSKKYLKPTQAQSQKFYIVPCHSSIC